jgi:hypothetical protein
MDPVRIFIGVGANDEDLEFQSVLHYSLERKTSQPLEINWIRLSRNPESFWYSDPQARKGWNTRTWHTPFSPLRWGVPAFCHFQGKAIYLDVDMIAMADIAELWNQEIKDEAGMLAKVPDICVTMYNNPAMQKALPPVEQIKTQPGLYRQVRYRCLGQAGLIQKVSGNWNCLDLKRDRGGEYVKVDDPEIKILHFTKVATQPHLRHALPRLKKEGRKHWYEFNRQEPIHDHARKDALAFFDKLLVEADEAGYKIDNYRNPEGAFGDYGRF